MNAVFISTLEVLVVALIIFAMFNEDRLIEMEDRFICRIRRRKLKAIKGGKFADKHCA